MLTRRSGEAMRSLGGIQSDHGITMKLTYTNRIYICHLYISVYYVIYILYTNRIVLQPLLYNLCVLYIQGGAPPIINGL